MSTRFDDVSVEERLRDAARAYTDAIGPAPDAWARLRTTIDEPRVLPLPRRRGVVTIAAAIAVAVAIVVLVVVVTLAGADRRSIQTPLRPAPTTLPDVSRTHALVVTPSTGLRDWQIVHVSARIAADGVAVWICRAGVTPPTVGNDCDPTTEQSSPPGGPANCCSDQPAADNSGVSATSRVLNRYPYMVRRTITLGGQPLDCAAAPGCVLYAADGGPNWQSKYGVAALAFDAAAPPVPGPTVTVTPPDGLRDGDVVTVRGRHFRPFASAGFAVCVNGTDVCDDFDVHDLPQLGPKGSFSATYRAWSVFSSADGTLHDCRSVTCVVRLASPANAVSWPGSATATIPGPPAIDVPISFAPGNPVSFPTLTLDPAGPYTDGQQVTMTVQGWPGSIGNRPGLSIASLGVGQCGVVDGLTLCARDTGLLIVDSVGAGTETRLRGPESDGRYTATVTLHRTLSAGAPGMGPFDCTQPGNCHVALAVEMNGEPPVHFTVILAVEVVVT